MASFPCLAHLYTLTLKGSFLPVKTSCFDHVKVWSPDQQWSGANEGIIWLGTSRRVSNGADLEMRLGDCSTEIIVGQ